MCSNYLILVLYAEIMRIIFIQFSIFQIIRFPVIFCPFCCVVRFYVFQQYSAFLLLAPLVVRLYSEFLLDCEKNVFLTHMVLDSLNRERFAFILVLWCVCGGFVVNL